MARCIHWRARVSGRDCWLQIVHLRISSRLPGTHAHAQHAVFPNKGEHDAAAAAAVHAVVFTSCYLSAILQITMFPLYMHPHGNDPFLTCCQQNERIPEQRHRQVDAVQAAKAAAAISSKARPDAQHSGDTAAADASRNKASKKAKKSKQSSASQVRKRSGGGGDVATGSLLDLMDFSTDAAAPTASGLVPVPRSRGGGSGVFTSPAMHSQPQQSQRHNAAALSQLLMAAAPSLASPTAAPQAAAAPPAASLSSAFAPIADGDSGQKGGQQAGSEADGSGAVRKDKKKKKSSSHRSSAKEGARQKPDSQMGGDYLLL